MTFVFFVLQPASAQQAVLTVEHACVGLGAQQESVESLVVFGAQQDFSEVLGVLGAQQESVKVFVALGVQQESGENLLALGAQQESIEAQDAIEARDADRLSWNEGRREDGQQDSWPSASSARQIQPNASSLGLYCSRARRACCRHGLPFTP